MKKIQLSDGMPTSIKALELPEETKLLLDCIKKSAISSGLSYREINKALHLADEELYKRMLEMPISQ